MSPEGYPDPSAQIFSGVQQPGCIGIFIVAAGGQL